VGFLNNTGLDSNFADRCRAMSTQRCFDTVSAENHRVIWDGEGSRTAFNGHRVKYDGWYTRTNNFMSSNWDGFRDDEAGLWQILFTVGTDR